MALVAGTIMGLLRAGFALFPGFLVAPAGEEICGRAAPLSPSPPISSSPASRSRRERSFIMLAVMLTAVLFDRAALTHAQPRDLGDRRHRWCRRTRSSARASRCRSPRPPRLSAPMRLVGLPRRPARPAAGQPRRSPAGPSAKMPARRGRPRRDLDRRRRRDRASTPPGISSRCRRSACFANLAAMPIVSLIVMPFAVLGALAMPFGLDGPFFDVMGKGLTATIAIAGWFSERSPVDVVGLVPPASVLLLTVALLIATICYDLAAARGVPFALAGLLTARRSPARPTCSSPRMAAWSGSPSATARSPSTAPGRTNSPSTTGNARCARTSMVAPEGNRSTSELAQDCDVARSGSTLPPNAQHAGAASICTGRPVPCHVIRPARSSRYAARCASGARAPARPPSVIVIDDATA